MCGEPKVQEVVTRTELDPAVRAELYGGSVLNPRGGFGSPDLGARLAVAAMTMAETLA
jgi:hypothetical protein